MKLIDAVEEATTKIIEQRELHIKHTQCFFHVSLSLSLEHKAAASSVGYTLLTYRPSETYSKQNNPLSHTLCLSLSLSAYVWSEKLIPLFCVLRQTLDSLIKVTMSSLAFKLMQVCIYIQLSLSIHIRIICHWFAMVCVSVSFLSSAGPVCREPVYSEEEKG